jgi:hypothetical protein
MEEIPQERREKPSHRPGEVENPYSHHGWGFESHRKLTFKIP